MLQVFLALLRGVNVGGKNKLPMKDLAAILIGAGALDVRTYTQSGNVLFRATPETAATIANVVSTRIRERFGFAVPVVVRSADEVGRVLRENPFLKEGVDEHALHVVFLAHKPDAERVNGLDPHRSPPDTFVVVGSEIYLNLPNGVAPSKFTNAYYDAKLKTVSTMRNWRTVKQLVFLMDEI